MRDSRVVRLRVGVQLDTWEEDAENEEGSDAVVQEGKQRLADRYVRSIGSMQSC